MTELISLISSVRPPTRDQRLQPEQGEIRPALDLAAEASAGWQPV
ncbi:hypothetical protein AB5J56_06540 [Streptomyces sp. R21]|uniref:Uncharacterized protein n=1 Tax=Streptomyces sp. R21 TaxID=3238627 RepID=A0AB39P1P7_9ACTN